MTSNFTDPPNATPIDGKSFVTPVWATWFQELIGELNNIVITGVQSVSGTANRITSTGGLNPVIDISASYVGQSSITTVGTLTTGATGAGFTINLTTSTISGTLPISNIDPDVSGRTVCLGKDGNGSTPSTGFCGAVTVPFSGTITKWYINSKNGEAGSATMDIKVNGSSIVGGGGNKPTLSAADHNSATVSGWSSTTLTAGDRVQGNLDTASGLTYVEVTLEITPT